MKIRTDFVTNSSSSSFVTYSIKSEELASLLKELKEYAVEDGVYGTSPCSDISIGDSIVEMDLPAPFRVKYLDEQLGMHDGDGRKVIQMIVDDICCYRYHNIRYAIRDFYKNIPSEKLDYLNTILRSAIDEKKVSCGTRKDYLDGKSDWHYSFIYHGETAVIYDDILWLYLNQSEEKIVIPEGVTELANSVFYKDSRFYSDIAEYGYTRSFEVKNIKLPETLKKIGSRAFYKCSDLESVNIPKSVNKIGKAAFRETAIREIIIPDGITRIEEQVFKGCKHLEKITLPDSLKTIEKNAFENCTSLKTIIIPESVDSIEAEAFLGCTTLEEAVFNGTQPAIGKDSFRGCKSLKQVPVSNENSESIVYTDELAGKKFLLTGKLSSMDRNKAEDLIEQHGGKIGNSVSRAVDFLVVGDEPGSKLEKAKQLGITLLTEQQLQDILSGAVSIDTLKKSIEFHPQQRDFGKLSEYESLLYDALLKAETQKEMQRILLDLCSIPNLFDLSNRMEVATLLLDGNTTNEVNSKTGASSSTITKINKTLLNGTKGLEYAFIKLSENNNLELSEYSKKRLYTFENDYDSEKNETHDAGQSSLFKYPSMPWLQLLVDTFMSIKTAEAMKYLLYDLCVDSELKSMIQRIKAAEMLMKGISVSEISKQTGISSSIIKKVDYAMHYLGTGGFQIVLERLI